MSKSLQIRSVDIEKFFLLVVDRQPSIQELRNIIELYVKNFNLTHISLSIPLDTNEDFLKHGHIPSPLTIDSFTNACIDIIHELGINVYFKGTFSGIENLYDFGFDKTTPIGTVDDFREDSWMGRISQWFDIHSKNIRKGDIIGIIPNTTKHIPEGNFFLDNLYENEPENFQTNFLTFYTELAKLYALKSTKQGNYSSQLYKDIVNGWIPSFIFDLTGIMSITYSDTGESPQELEKIFNELYLQFHQPIFLNGWSLPKESLRTEDINKKSQEYFNVFARLRNKGILIGMDYFDGLFFDEGVFSDDNLNEEGIFLKEFFSQSETEQSIIKDKNIDQSLSDSIEKDTTLPEKVDIDLTSIIKEVVHKKKRGRPMKAQVTTITEQIPQEVKLSVTSEKKIRSHIHKKMKKVDYMLLLKLFIYMIVGMFLTMITTFLMGVHFNDLILIMLIVYTMLVMILHLLTMI